MDLPMPGAPKPEILTSSSSFGKIKFILGSVIILFIILLTVGFYFYSQKPSVNPASNNSPVNQIIKSDTKSFTPPLKIDDKLIKSKGFLYVVQTRIKSINASKIPYVIETNITDSTMPRIEVSTSAALFVKRDGKDYPVKIQQFQKGNLVNISLFYDLQKSKWSTRRIVKIINNATPSATLKPTTKP